MDPYLENRHRWAGFHNEFLVFLNATLNRVLPDGFVSRSKERCYREAYIEVVAVANLDEVITVIELLSPSNKEAPGRDLYLRKQLDLLESNTNLVELDLLRTGRHLVAAPFELLQRQGVWDYLVSLHRPLRRYHYEFYFLSLRQALPEIRIPLSPGTPDTIVSLQDVFTLCYDSGGYSRLIDYRLPPTPPLSPSDQAWATSLLSEW